MGCFSTDRMIAGSDSDAVDGQVKWTPIRSIWTGGVTLVALVFGALTFSAEVAVLFLVTTGITLCLGHSLGMHRLLIHRSFKTSSPSNICSSISARLSAWRGHSG